MTTLYLDRPDLELRKEPGALVIYRDQQRIRSVPLGVLERVVVHGNVTLKTSVLAGLAERDIGLLVLGGRMAEHRAMLLGRPHGDVRIRMAQFQAHADTERRLALAKAFATGKIAAQARLLERAQTARPDRRRELSRGLNAISAQQARVADALAIEALLGHEGAAASAYFPALASVFPPALGFKDRNRRPPRDPVNACLSLAYTLIHADAARAAWAAGLDPLLGFLHEPARGRESLASGIVEPLRPHVDEWVWRLMRERTLRDDHFAQIEGACLLSKTGRARFYPAWESNAKGLRRLLRFSVRTLVRTLVEAQTR